MATAEWGSLEWGAGEWGSIDSGSGPWAAVETLSLDGLADFHVDLVLNASGTLSLSGAAGMTSAIQMASVGELRLDGGGANLRVARHATRLHACGDPLSTACAHWMP
jgi:hypothetical protein